MFKKFLTGYFSFTSKERRGVVVLLAAILFFTLLPFLFPLLVKRRMIDPAAFEKEIASLKPVRADSNNRWGQRNYPGNDYLPYRISNKKKFLPREKAGELFYFDPNTLDDEGWKRLGIREKTAGTIRHYLEKGGHFKDPGDIRKIWGFHEDEVQRLLPFVRIRAGATTIITERKTMDHKPDPAPKYIFKTVDINTADTTAFIALPGIGSKLANRIVKFRDKLGGFYTPEQVGETFALPDSTFRKIRSRLILHEPSVKKININIATLEELKMHPYIRYNLANAIIQYRQQHGRFAVIADLKKIMTVTDEMYNKLLPYLSVE